MSRASRAAMAIAVAVLSLIAFSQPATTHERRTLGPYQLVVGWSTEPSFVGQPNGVSLRVSDTRITPAKAVEGVEKTLTAEVFQGGATRGFAVTLRTVFGTPGLYEGDLVPTREGSYRFVFKGKIENLDVNEVFESGPGRFDEIRPLTPLQYPEAVPAGGELARALSDIRSGIDQVRILAAAAVVLALASLALTFRRRRA